MVKNILTSKKAILSTAVSIDPRVQSFLAEEPKKSFLKQSTYYTTYSSIHPIELRFCDATVGRDDAGGGENRGI